MFRAAEPLRAFAGGLAGALACHDACLLAHSWWPLHRARTGTPREFNHCHHGLVSILKRHVSSVRSRALRMPHSACAVPGTQTDPRVCRAALKTECRRGKVPLMLQAQCSVQAVTHRAPSWLVLLAMPPWAHRWQASAGRSASNHRRRTAKLFSGPLHKPPVQQQAQLLRAAGACAQHPRSGVLQR